MGLANKILVIGILVSPIGVHAGEAKGATCPNRQKLNSLCSEIQSRSEASSPLLQNPYNYYKSILEASCVTDNDSTETMNTKVSSMWTQLENELTCTNTLFSVPKGNVIKFGIAMNFDRFIHDITLWGVNLKRVDPVDGRTLLDYVRDEREKYKDNPVEPKLTMFYDKLRRAGARHATEL